MSMAIHRAYANVVPAMLHPVAKLGRVAKFGSGRSESTSATTQPAVQGTSRPQPTDTTSTPEQIHASFQYALVFQGNAGMTGGTVAQSSTEMQAGGVQSGVAGYAQVEQQAGQTLDLTA